MKTMDLIRNNKIGGFLLFIFLMPLVMLAETSPTMAEEAEAAKRTALIGEVSIGVLFVVAVTLFLVFKSKQDKKERARQAEQMKKVQANKRRAA